MGRGERVVSEKMKLLSALIGLQLCFAGFHIVSRVALNIGVSKAVYPVYRNIIALLLLGPFAYFLEKYVHLCITLNSLRIRLLIYLHIIEIGIAGRRDPLSHLLCWYSFFFLHYLGKKRITVFTNGVIFFLKQWFRWVKELTNFKCFSNNRITANQGFYLLGLYYASPTFASAMQNSVPAITFVMASALG